MGVRTASNFQSNLGIPIINETINFNKAGGINYNVIDVDQTGGKSQTYIFIYKFLIPATFKGKDFNFFIGVDDIDNNQYLATSEVFIQRLFKVRP